MVKKGTRVATKKVEKPIVSDDGLYDELSKTGDPEAKPKFRIANIKMSLTYKCHLPKMEYRKWFVDLVSQKKGKNGGSILVKTLELAHETGDKSHNYDHTHVVFLLSEEFNSTDPRVFDFTHKDLNDGEPIHPFIRIIRTMTHYKRSLAYLAKEDSENLHLIPDQPTAWDKVTALRECPNNEERVKEMTSGDQVFDPLLIMGAIRVAEMLGPTQEMIIENKSKMALHPREMSHPWQKRLISYLSKPPTGRYVLWIYDPTGGCGKSTFIKSMKTWYPQQVAKVAMAKVADLAHGLRKKMECSNPWNGNTLFIDIAKSTDPLFTDRDNTSMYVVIENLSDGELFAGKYDSVDLSWAPGHVVVFANWLPNFNKLSADRWKIMALKKHDPNDCIFVEGENKIVTAAPFNFAAECGISDDLPIEFEEADDFPPELD